MIDLILTGSSKGHHGVEGGALHTPDKQQIRGSPFREGLSDLWTLLSQLESDKRPIHNTEDGNAVFRNKSFVPLS